MRDDEDDLLRSVATRNANAILLARRRAEEDLLQAKESLESKTRELAHSLALMRATLESTTDGILVTDNTGKITGCNDKYCRMSGMSAAAMASGEHRHLIVLTSALFHDPAAFVARIDEIYATAPAETYDVLELADGRTVERFSRVQVVEARPIGRVWSFRDVTERRRAEEERARLLESERRARTQAESMSEMKDEFLATLSHELRTPLSAILGWAQVLRRGMRNEADLHRGLEIIERNARAQTQLIEDLLDMSRITSGKIRLDVQLVTPIAFVEAAVETVRPAAEAKGIRLDPILDPAAGPIAGDPSRLQQVVWNLLSNAVKFTSRGGRIQVLLQRVNSHVEIAVADTGVGIAPEFLAHVFERFRQADASTTRRHGGLGLGLSIVKQLVELHGGTVRADSAGEGLGSTFSVHLPLTAVYRSTRGEARTHPRTPTEPAAVVHEPTDLSGIKVLVVDDETDARELIERVLSDGGAQVVTASSAAEALLLMERERPNLLLTDIGLPVVDGFELLRQVRTLAPERGGTIPAIALTAFARSEDRTRALRSGFALHIPKPVESAELLAAVARAAGHSTA